MEFEHCTCDLCGGSNYHVRYRKPDTWLWLNQFEFPVVECINCGLVYVNPRPTQKTMAYYYPTNYHDNRTTEQHLYRYKIQSEYLPKLTNEAILDIGCAKGDFLIYLKQKYKDIKLFGMDYYCNSVNSEEISFQQKDLPQCNYASDQFDIVTAWAVFEHLHEPSEYFQEVSRILKGNGKFIFLVTNSESLYGRHAFTEDIPRHLYHFSEKTLKRYADKYGFTLSNMWYDDRVFDGRGHGTFRHLIPSLLGITWEDRYFTDRNRILQCSERIGNLADSVIFSRHWEAKCKRSGIIVVEFTKQ